MGPGGPPCCKAFEETPVGAPRTGAWAGPGPWPGFVTTESRGVITAEQQRTAPGAPVAPAAVLTIMTGVPGETWTVAVAAAVVGGGALVWRIAITGAVRGIGPPNVGLASRACKADSCGHRTGVP
mmetsp:Transcript_79810/g.165890  ORF Transcript_79810/g.165890 Transcript_79810/m.165890 type:complete len:125 (+) Transcript_79810:573-947(+)